VLTSKVATLARPTPAKVSIKPNADDSDWEEF
jgi:methyl-accepting chemotaxis protein